MRQGEVVQLGRHRLMCGDAFNPDHVDALMQGVKPDMLYCDPPYGIALDTRNMGNRKPSSKWGKRGDVEVREVRQVDYAPVIGDSASFDPQPIMDAFSDVVEQFWWGAHFYAEMLSERNEGSWLVWDKRGKGNLDKVHGNHFEMCWSRKRHKSEIIRILWCGIYGMHGEDDHRYHPMQKPVDLAQWFLGKYSVPGAVILDLFGGSGSTLLACEKMDRVAYCMEISPDYCDVIVERYEEFRRQPKLFTIDAMEQAV